MQNLKLKLVPLSLQLVLETVLNTIVSEAKPAFYSDL
jgi:hypothetical protein